MKKRVLIVDDEVEIVKYLSQRLEREDFEPIIAYDGSDVMEMIAQHHVDAVITDIVMSGMDGYALCQKLKESETCSELPVIVCTAYASKEREFRKLGIDDYLVKPFCFDDLVDSLNRIFSQTSHSIKYKKILVQTDDTLAVESAVQLMKNYGFRIDVMILPEINNLIEETFHAQPDIVIFDASQKIIAPEKLIKSLRDYVEFKDLDIFFYASCQEVAAKHKKQNQNYFQELKKRCLDAGATGYMSSLDQDNFLNIMMEYCKIQKKETHKV